MKPLILTLNLLCGADAASPHYALQPAIASNETVEAPTLPSRPTVVTGWNVPEPAMTIPWHWQYKPNRVADRLTWAVNIADGLSTLGARTVLRNRFVEQNQIMGNIGFRFIAVKSGAIAAINMTAHQMRARGHRRLANLLQFGSIAATGSIVASNLHQIGKIR